MPSKEQKKINKREQNELIRLSVQQKHMEELEWENGTNRRNILRQQLQQDKIVDKIRRKTERNDLLDQEQN